MGLAASKQEAFWEACGFGKPDTVRRFIEQGGIDVNWVSYTHNSCAIHVASQGKPEIVKMLIDAKCNVNVKDDRGNLALHHAAMKGHGKIMQTLLDAGSEIDTQDKNGWTSLINAAYFGQPEAVEVLIRNKCNVHLLNKDERHALHEACRSQCSDENGLAIIACHLVEAGSDLNAKSSDVGEADFTALMFASYHGHAEVADVLAEAGCEINSQGSNGWSALHWAADRGHTQVAKVLIHWEIDPLLEGRRGELAVDRAKDNELKELLTEATAEAKSHKQLQDMLSRSPVSTTSPLSSRPDSVCSNLDADMESAGDPDSYRDEIIDNDLAAMLQAASNEKAGGRSAEEPESSCTSGTISEKDEKEALEKEVIDDPPSIESLPEEGTLGSPVCETSDTLGSPVCETSDTLGSPVCETSDTLGSPVCETSDTLGSPVCETSDTLGSPVCETSDTLGSPVTETSDTLGSPVCETSNTLGSPVCETSDTLGSPVCETSDETATMKSSSELATPDGAEDSIGAPDGLGDSVGASEELCDSHTTESELGAQECSKESVKLEDRSDSPVNDSDLNKENTRTVPCEESKLEKQRNSSGNTNECASPDEIINNEKVSDISTSTELSAGHSTKSNQGDSEHAIKQPKSTEPIREGDVKPESIEPVTKGDVKPESTEPVTKGDVKPETMQPVSKGDVKPERTQLVLDGDLKSESVNQESSSAFSPDQLVAPTLSTDQNESRPQNPAENNPACVEEHQQQLPKSESAAQEFSEPSQHNSPARSCSSKNEDGNFSDDLLGDGGYSEDLVDSDME